MTTDTEKGGISENQNSLVIVQWESNYGSIMESNCYRGSLTLTYIDYLSLYWSVHMSNYILKTGMGYSKPEKCPKEYFGRRSQCKECVVLANCSINKQNYSHPRGESIGSGREVI